MPIILRDIGLLERRTFNQLLKHNLEGISSGSLATKLKRLEHEGLIAFVPANEYQQKKLYLLDRVRDCLRAGVIYSDRMARKVASTEF